MPGEPHHNRSPAYSAAAWNGGEVALLVVGLAVGAVAALTGSLAVLVLAIAAPLIAVVLQDRRFRGHREAA